MKMQLKRRVMAFLLTVCMVTALFPTVMTTEAADATTRTIKTVVMGLDSNGEETMQTISGATINVYKVTYSYDATAEDHISKVQDSTPYKTSLNGSLELTDTDLNTLLPTVYASWDAFNRALASMTADSAPIYTFVIETNTNGSGVMHGVTDAGAYSSSTTTSSEYVNWSDFNQGDSYRDLIYYYGTGNNYVFSVIGNDNYDRVTYISGATVTLNNGTDVSNKITGSNGNYAIDLSSLTAGRYTLTVTLPDGYVFDSETKSKTKTELFETVGDFGWGTVFYAERTTQNQYYHLGVWNSVEDESLTSGLTFSAKTSDNVSIGKTNSGSNVDGSAYCEYIINLDEMKAAFAAGKSVTITTTLDADSAYYFEDLDLGSVSLDYVKTMSITYESMNDVPSDLNEDGSRWYSDGLTVYNKTTLSNNTYTFDIFGNNGQDQDDVINGAKLTLTKCFGYWDDEELIIDSEVPFKSSTTGTISFKESDLGYIGDIDGGAFFLRVVGEIPSSLQEKYFFDMDNKTATYIYTAETISCDLDDIFDNNREGSFYALYQGDTKFVYVAEGMNVQKSTFDKEDGTKGTAYVGYVWADNNTQLNSRIAQMAKEFSFKNADDAAIYIVDADYKVDISATNVAALRAKGWLYMEIDQGSTIFGDNFGGLGAFLTEDKEFAPTLTVGKDSDAKKAIDASGYDSDYMIVTIGGTVPGNVTMALRYDDEMFGVDFYDAYENESNGRDCLEIPTYYYNKSAGEFQNYVSYGEVQYSWNEDCYYYYVDCGSYLGTFVWCADTLSKKLTGGKGEEVSYSEDVPQAQMNDAILSDISHVDDDTDYLAVTIPDGYSLSQKVFEKAKESGITLRVMNSSGTAAFAFEDLSTFGSMSGDMNLDATTNEPVAAVDKVMKNYTVSSGAVTTDVSFAYDGILPGTAKVTLDLRGCGFQNGDTVTLYYCNPETNKMEVASTGVYYDGYATFTMTHCSDYLVTNGTLTESETGKAPESENPKTGDAQTWAYWLMLVAGAAFVTMAGLKRRKNKI